MAAIATLAITVFAACQDDAKEQAPTPSQTKSSPQNGSLAEGNPNAGKGLNNIWAPNEPDGAGGKGKCLPVKSSCFDEVVITPPKITDLLGVCNGGPTALAAYFSGSDWHEFFPSLLTEYPRMLADLRSGNFYLSHVHNPNTNKYYFLVMSNGTNADPVYIFDVLQGE